MFLQNLGYFVILLGVLIFVHELGHFLLAKALGVKVLRFSIGFGPRIFGFTRGETEYRVAWLPLGGYVKMAGELPSEDLPPEDEPRGFLSQRPWKRALIVAAGPVFNLIFPVLIFFVVYVGAHEAQSARIGSVEPGLPAAEAGLEPGDTVLAVDGQAVRTFEDLRSLLRPRYDQRIELAIERDGRRFQAVLTPSRALETDPVESVPRGLIGISPWTKAVVLGVAPGSPAEQAGVRTFDRLLAIDGKAVKDERQLGQVLAGTEGVLVLTLERRRPVELPGAGLSVPSVVTAEVLRQPGAGYEALGAERSDLYVGSVMPGSAAASLGLSRGDRLLEINGKVPRSWTALSLELERLGKAPFELAWRSGGEVKRATTAQTTLEVKDEFGGPMDTLSLGVAPYAVESFKPETVTVHMGPAEAMRESLKVVPEVIRKMVLIIGSVFTGHIPFKAVGGPVTMYQIAARSAEAGLDMFLNSMAVISVNLGLVNLLPVPVLDGFHLVAALWEAVRRKPIPARAREIANMVGLAMLLILMVMVLKNDLMRLLAA